MGTLTHPPRQALPGWYCAEHADLARADGKRASHTRVHGWRCQAAAGAAHANVARNVGKDSSGCGHVVGAAGLP